MKTTHQLSLARFLAGFLALFACRIAVAEPLADDVEFFEKQVRPILIQSCQKCHGESKQEGGLRLDSRMAVLKGGDSGAVVEPGKPDESLLIEAIGYGSDIKMPPKAKLGDEQIAALTAWVRRGAPWPIDKTGGVKPVEFNLAARKARQWVYQPVLSQAVPKVKDDSWPRNSVDFFILSKLENAGLAPAAQTDKRTLLRRVTFDLTGLPPTAAEIEAYLADDSPRAFERVVDRLLASRHYGERWARHWLDLVRFAETHGHEFDFEMPLAYEYRDYVIRALNADVPYNQFVVEHIAGDLLAEPRRHSTERFNESIIGTGFWYLGEATHSPVDVRADEASRIDNQIDVFAKTFLAQTVACARCHDHKFDAISTKDYYALSGYLQSSRYAVECVDPPESRLEIIEKLKTCQREARQLLQAVARETAKSSAEKMAAALLASLAVLRPDFDKTLDAGAEAVRGADDLVFEDFEKPAYTGWTATGNAFGEVPNRRPLPAYQGEVGAQGLGFVNSHSALDREGNRTATDELTGTLTSNSFKISRPAIHFLIGGGGHTGKTCLNLLVDRKVVRTATGRNDNRMNWSTFDVGDLAGKEARFEIVDDMRGSWGNIGVDQIVFSNRPLPAALGSRIAVAAKKYQIDAAELMNWVTHLQGAALTTSTDPFHLWAQLASRTGGLAHPAIADYLSEQAAGQRAIADRIHAAEQNEIVFEDFSNDTYRGWFAAGDAFGSGPIDFAIAPAEKRLTAGARSSLAGPMAHSGALSNRLEGVLRSRTFTIEKNHVLYHAAGRGAKINLIVDSYQFIRNPIYGGLTIALDNPEQMQWFAMEVSKWVGHTAYIELIDPGEGFLAVDRIVFTDESTAGEGENAVSRHLLEERDINSPEKIAQRYATLIERAFLLGDDAKPRAHGEREAEDAMRNFLLTQNLAGTLSQTLAVSHRDLQKKMTDLSASKQRLEAEIHYGRKVMAMIEGTPEDDRVHLRGSPHKFGDVVPRRLLEALAGLEQASASKGSGRLELAHAMIEPASPVLARVIVNRVWKHHFGAGLVRTPDDFGNMGQPPTHPELLDFLAAQFVTQKWSFKQLHRLLVLSQTYQMSSLATDARAEAADPENKMWHRMHLHRLEAEVIRDSMLAVSGRLDARMYGPGVMPYLTPFMVGRGRPDKSGPLDGDGRRTVYLNVRRNFLSPMLLAFDYPIPFSTIGRRSISNVPAQALALMNNPFVLQQAEVWAKRVIAEHSHPRDRLAAMYISAFGRPPTAEDEQISFAFLEEQSRQYPADEALRPWADLAHVLFNVKEFIFVE